MINYYTILQFQNKEEITDKEVEKRAETEIARLTKLKEDAQFKLLNAKTENEKIKIRMEINALENNIQIVLDAWRAIGTENARRHYEELRNKEKNSRPGISGNGPEKISENSQPITKLVQSMNTLRKGTKPIDTKKLVEGILAKAKAPKEIQEDGEQR